MTGYTRACLREESLDAARERIGITEARPDAQHRNEGGLTFMVADHGPGIDALNLPNVALEWGLSTKGTAGLGYKLILASADKVYLATGPEGTAVTCEVGLKGHSGR